MVLTVTLNPIIEHRLHYSETVENSTNRNGRLSYYAGGKGINVSRQLNKLGIKNLALTFLGGDHGRRLRSALTAEEIAFTAVNTVSETRYGSVIIDEGRGTVSHFFGENSIISESEVEGFKSRLDKMIQNCEYVVFSGSSPSPLCDDIFAYGLEIAEKYDKTSILDTYGNSLHLAIEKNPTVLHLNRKEASEFTGTKVETESEILDALRIFAEKGVKISVITDGSNPLYVNSFGFNYKVIPPAVDRIDETGSGDAFVAGFVYGLSHDEILTDIIKYATASGAANASMISVCEVEPEIIKSKFNEVIVEPVGKKMNLMNEMV
ncbi:MAG: 1-phosphofructokinase [Ignavibacteria bacterium]|nr:1-phosphofructokinase [Ignavibacteria bacterium]